MDGAQLDHYYEDQLSDLVYALSLMTKVNYLGLDSWLRAKATWRDDLPISADDLNRIQDALITMLPKDSNVRSIVLEAAA